MALDHASELIKNLKNYINLKITSAVFIEKRRWNIIIDKKLIIKLPAENYSMALKNLSNVFDKLHGPKTLAATRIKIMDITCFVRLDNCLSSINVRNYRHRHGVIVPHVPGDQLRPPLHVTITHVYSHDAGSTNIIVI